MPPGFQYADCNRAHPGGANTGNVIKSRGSPARQLQLKSAIDQCRTTQLLYMRTGNFLPRSGKFPGRSGRDLWLASGPGVRHEGPVRYCLPGGKYYGLKMAAFLFATFYVAMAAAALIVDLIFGGFALIPSERQARVVEAPITWNYTTWLNLVFLVLAGLLVRRFLKTGGPAMLPMMNRPVDHGEAHHHAGGW
jgi:hypothetical protein